MKGIDVSKHNGTIDWEKVKADGVAFAMIRAGFGKNNIDEQFKRNITECNRLGIPVGIYWFSYALNEKMAKEEAEYCLAAIKDYSIEFPVAFDLEYDSLRYAQSKGVTIDKHLASKLVDAFCQTIESRGYYAMNYANQDYLANRFDLSVTNKYDLWYAFWSDKVDRPYGIWQYTSKGKLAGISGHVDLNYTDKNYAEIIRQRGLNRLSQTSQEDGEPEAEPRDHKSLQQNTLSEVKTLLSKVLDLLETL